MNEAVEQAGILPDSLLDRIIVSLQNEPEKWEFRYVNRLKWYRAERLDRSIALEISTEYKSTWWWRLEGTVSLRNDPIDGNDPDKEDLLQRGYLWGEESYKIENRKVLKQLKLILHEHCVVKAAERKRSRKKTFLNFWMDRNAK